MNLRIRNEALSRLAEPGILPSLKIDKDRGSSTQERLSSESSTLYSMRKPQGFTPGNPRAPTMPNRLGNNTVKTSRQPKTPKAGQSLEIWGWGHLPIAAFALAKSRCKQVWIMLLLPIRGTFSYTTLLGLCPRLAAHGFHAGAFDQDCKMPAVHFLIEMLPCRDAEP